MKRALMALRLWVGYNRRILEFAEKNPDRVLLVLTADDFDEVSGSIINKIVSDRWRIRLRPIDFGKIYASSLMKKKIPAWIRGLISVYRPAPLLFKQLDRLRKVLRVDYLETQDTSCDPRTIDLGQTARKRVVCVVAPREFAYSETFVRDHIRRLPAKVKVVYGGSRYGDDAGTDGATGRKLVDILINRFPNRSADGHRLISIAGRGADVVLRDVFKVPGWPLGGRALRRYLYRERVEAVLAEFGQTGVQAMSACRSAGIPLVVHFHGFDAYSRKELNRYLPSYREMFIVASAIIAASRDMVEHLAALGAPRGKLFYNPCGVDVDLFAGADPAAAPPTFLAVGRFVEKKAPYLTLLAFKRVWERYPEARLLMLGDGELLEVCQQLTRALGIEHAVCYEGVLSQLEVAVAMRRVRAFIQHSVRTSYGDSEGTPVSVLEASAAGLPVVSTRHGGIKDVVVDGQTGFLVAEGDIGGMARRMMELIESPNHAAALGRRAREYVCANFSMEKRIAVLMDVIERSIEKRGYDEP